MLDLKNTEYEKEIHKYNSTIETYKNETIENRIK